MNRFTVNSIIFFLSTIATLIVAFKWVSVDLYATSIEKFVWAALFFAGTLLSGTVLMQYRHGEGRFARIVQRIYEDL